MATKFRLVLNILVFTSIIGLAISYASQLFYPYFPKINFLEAVGIYCLFTPINHLLMSIGGKDDKFQ